MGIIRILAALNTKVNPGDVGVIKKDADVILNNGLNMAYFAIGVISVIVIIIAGFTMVTAAGDAEAIKKAKNSILYAVIGLVVILLAFTITQFIMGVI